MHLLDKQNIFLQNALYIEQERNFVANDFLELASRRRCVYVSGFFNDVASTAKTNFIVYFDHVQAANKPKFKVSDFVGMLTSKVLCYLPFRRNEQMKSAGT